MFARTGATDSGGRTASAGVTSVVLGIDPGLTRCGFAVVRSAGSTRAALAIGVLTSPTDMDLAGRVAAIQADVEALLDEFAPSAMAIEQVFQRDNTRSAMSVAHASGAIMAVTARRGIPVHPYTPTQVKAAVAGHGSADKTQVGRMVATRLGLRSVPSPADAADAAAVALCHLACAPLSAAVARATGTARQ